MVDWIVARGDLKRDGFIEVLTFSDVNKAEEYFQKVSLNLIHGDEVILFKKQKAICRV